MTPKRLSTLLANAAIGLVLALPSARAQVEDKVLNIYNWSDYIGDEVISRFEKETGIKVRYDVFDNNEIVHAKLVAGKTGYDLVVPSSNWAKLQLDGGLLQKIDKSRIPNLKNLDPAVQAQLAKVDQPEDSGSGGASPVGQGGSRQRVHGQLDVGLHHRRHQCRQGPGGAGRQSA
jgi:putrescine transport system substrate-binding protein